MSKFQSWGNRVSNETAIQDPPEKSEPETIHESSDYIRGYNEGFKAIQAKFDTECDKAFNRGYDQGYQDSGIENSPDWTAFPDELTDYQKAALLQIVTRENGYCGKLKAEPDTIPASSLDLTPECLLAYQYGTGLTNKSILEEQYRGFSICYENDFSEFCGETQVLIDEILNRSEEFDPFDKIRTLAEKFNHDHTEKLSQFVNGTGTLLAPDFEEIETIF